MPNKPARTIDEQLQLLKERGMLFRDEPKALVNLRNISYYRLKGYWWDMQSDRTGHTFQDNTYFEVVIERYNFDRQLRLILFDAIERIEIALRTKMIYHLSLEYGPLWYQQEDLFVDQTKHNENLEHLEREFEHSQEIFAKDHRRRYPNEDPEAWKVLEVVSMGTLSKFYKNLKHQLPEKSQIANELGLNLHNELSSWLEAITYIRNIIAHHSRIWSRNMVKRPIDLLNNPISDWFNRPLRDVQKKKPFLIISTMVYLCNNVVPGNGAKDKILELFRNNPNVPIYKLGFLNNWNRQPVWR
ncbi:MAG: Abi family protein [Bacteroidales bacterium]|nr:Abi family protein [Bacteroidales bacterium]